MFTSTWVGIELMGWIFQVLHSLEYIHSKGYTHNDVKAANLLSHPSNPNLLYLVDFGLAVKYMKVLLVLNMFNACGFSQNLLGRGECT